MPLFQESILGQEVRSRRGPALDESIEDDWKRPFAFRTLEPITPAPVAVFRRLGGCGSALNRNNKRRPSVVPKAKGTSVSGDKPCKSIHADSTSSW
jgi:hypothetical protein